MSATKQEPDLRVLAVDPTPTRQSAYVKGTAPLCDCYGCGMLSTESTDGLNHCDHHKSWPKSKDGKVARAMKGTE